MFAGHLAAAVAAKRLEPRASLGLLVAASFGLDLLWPLFLLGGAETVRIDPGNTAFSPLDFQSYPWSHSLAAVVVWSVVAGSVTAAVVKRRRVAWIVAALVLSHWVLDFVTHRPDLPLWPSGPTVGLGLWDSIAWTIVVEGGLLVGAVALYAHGTRARDASGRWAFWVLVALVGALWVGGPWSPPPPSATAVAVVGLATWILPLWGHWIERHRVTARHE